MNYIFLVISLALRCTLIETEDKGLTKKISIGFFLEKEQTELIPEVGNILKELENSDPSANIQFNDYYIRINRNDYNETNANLCSVLHKGLHVVMDFSYKPWNEGQDILLLANIPLLKVDISIKPFLRIIEKYLLIRGANDVVMIFQNQREHEEGIFYVVQESQLRVSLYNGITEDNINKIVSIRPIPSYYAVFATTDIMNHILEKAYVNKLLFRPDKWNLFFLDLKYAHFRTDNNFAGMDLIMPAPNITCKALGLSSNCRNDKSFSFPKVILKKVLSSFVYEFLSKKMDIQTWDCNSDFETNLTVPDQDESFVYPSYIDSSQFLMKDENETIRIAMNMSIMKVSSDQGRLVQIANWNEPYSRIEKTESVKPAKRFFRIGTTEAIPWSYMVRDSVTGEIITNHEGYAVWNGYCIDLMEKLSAKLNFDYEIVSPKHGTFGKRYSDGSWDGLVGDLASGETDIAVAALKMTSEREEVIDYVAPYFEQTGISIVIRKGVRQTSLFKFMTVLRLEVWLSILASLIATAIMIWFLDKYSPYSAKNSKESYPYPCRDFTLKESFWFALTSFTPQGGGEAPKSLSGRTLVAAYWLFVVLMLATFTANLAAFLTVERMQTPVQSLDQLARQSRINYTVVEGSDVHKHFINMKFAEDTIYRLWKELTLNATSDYSKYRIWDYPIKEQYGHILLAINASNPVKDAAEGFRKVNEHENADFAFIHDAAEIKYEISKNCNLTEVGEVFAEQPYAIAVQQGSHLQDEISYAVLELQKDRFFEGLTAKFWNHSANCGNNDDNEGITLESLGGVFIATLFGLALAMITLAGEVIYYRRKKNITVENVKPQKGTLEKVTKISNQDSLSITPPPSFEKLMFRGQVVPEEITFGKDFVPVKNIKKDISYYPDYRRSPIHGKYFE